jgi:oligogalacturonide transport system permease protein
MSKKTREQVSTVVRYTVLILVGFVMFYPMLWMVGASFKASNNEIYSTISFLPKSPSFQAYIDGWTATGNPYSLYLINTFKIVIPKVVGAVVASVVTAYGFSRFEFPGKTFWFSILLATLFLPQVVLNIPQFLLFRTWGWTNSYLPLVVPTFFGAEPYFIFMLVQFMRSVSRELEEAAEIDGCNSFERLVYIVVPMVKPTIVSVALFQFMWAFNDFQGPLIYIDSVKKYPTSLGLRLLTDAETGFEWNKVLALSVITLLPSLIVFFLAQDQFVDGIAAGGVKG